MDDLREKLRQVLVRMQEQAQGAGGKEDFGDSWAATPPGFNAADVEEGQNMFWPLALQLAAFLPICRRTARTAFPSSS